MPNHTIYIRKEDQPKWDAINDKSGWVREQLHRREIKGIYFDESSDIPPEELDKILKKMPIPRVITPKPVVVPKPPEMSDMRWLQHLKDNGIDLADTSVDTNPDWGA